MSDAWDLIAEARIQKAVDRGELCNLGGEGRPVEVSEDFSIPWTVRWLLKKSRDDQANPGKHLQVKAIATNVSKGQLRRARLNLLVQNARGTKSGR
jgi:hypothetical protein